MTDHYSDAREEWNSDESVNARQREADTQSLYAMGLVPEHKKLYQNRAAIRHISSFLAWLNDNDVSISDDVLHQYLGVDADELKAEESSMTNPRYTIDRHRRP
tara:strand:+ start:699 stop:1007 length:309 start_codon:yes stop_codon:yes gene_type:complete